ncbi:MULTISPECIES: Rieske (2Fe-2S) protein [Amphritea]|uniref:Ferredoxin subunit of nitrite reductase or a ring-hydroxylating dioxygenase n=2 Tax=Amphritea TaxID=515417 RepID=A0A1H9LFG3_9GAMM|nr:MULTISPECIES: Rieske 2Fe-2S domain-containing protein [Amphritea]MBN0989207.1 Rieske 2Fe-2S domain-containing protein [Amphritea pacifica]MBN1008562.1 Rieske 2Fe-2S domain-containing protein [Amphritea pacifica]SER10232.1 Ferredoxin subunit of nitrite reductase or a ring-hydroxylating dioxygenase [Amphritea atlantica]
MPTVTPLFDISELTENSAKGIELNQRKLFAVCRQGRIYLYENRCPHKGVPLEWLPDTFLDVEKQFIQCSTHGALFTIDKGLCIAGPCAGASLIPVSYEIIDGQLCIPE